MVTIDLDYDWTDDPTNPEITLMDSVMACKAKEYIESLYNRDKSVRFDVISFLNWQDLSYYVDQLTEL